MGKEPIHLQVTGKKTDLMSLQPSWEMSLLPKTQSKNTKYKLTWTLSQWSGTQKSKWFLGTLKGADEVGSTLGEPTLSWL